MSPHPVPAQEGTTVMSDLTRDLVAATIDERLAVARRRDAAGPRRRHTRHTRHTLASGLRRFADRVDDRPCL